MRRQQMGDSPERVGSISWRARLARRCHENPSETACGGRRTSLRLLPARWAKRGPQERMSRSKVPRLLGLQGRPVVREVSRRWGKSSGERSYERENRSRWSSVGGNLTQRRKGKGSWSARSSGVGQSVGRTHPNSSSRKSDPEDGCLDGDIGMYSTKLISYNMKRGRCLQKEGEKLGWGETSRSAAATAGRQAVLSHSVEVEVHAMYIRARGRKAEKSPPADRRMKWSVLCPSRRDRACRHRGGAHRRAFVRTCPG